MRTSPSRNSLLALTALAALTVYILACTAFSPDDSKVLYPTIDARTGTTGIAAYDRTSGKSELLFAPAFQDLETLKTEPLILRPHWLLGGKRVLVAWPGGNTGGDNDRGLSLAVLPFGGIGPVQLFSLPGLRDTAQICQRPLPIAGHFLFLTPRGESNTTSIVRLDLITGELRSQTNLPALALLPAPQGDSIAYLAAAPGAEEQTELGTLNPDTFARTPRFRIQGSLLNSDKPEGFLAVSRDAKRLAFADTENDKPICRVLQSGKPFKTLPLPDSDQKLSFGNAQFAPDGEILYVSFMDRGAGGTNASFGVLELPLNGGTVRRNTLIQGIGTVDNTFALYFQIDLSNDGKTLAVASTYLAYEEVIKLKPADCALFLLNLADPQRSVTRVPIPLPPQAMLAK